MPPVVSWYWNILCVCVLICICGFVSFLLPVAVGLIETYGLVEPRFLLD